MRFITHTEKRDNGWYSVATFYDNSRVVDQLFDGPHRNQMIAKKHADTMANALYVRWTEGEADDLTNLTMEL